MKSVECRIGNAIFPLHRGDVDTWGCPGYAVGHVSLIPRGPIWVPLRFHDLRHMAGTPMHEAGVPLRRAQEILGHASERTTLPICTHAMRRTRDDSVDKIAELAGLSKVGNSWETTGSVEAEEAELSACFSGSPGWSISGGLTC